MPPTSSAHLLLQRNVSNTDRDRGAPGHHKPSDPVAYWQRTPKRVVSSLAGAVRDWHCEVQARSLQVIANRRHNAALLGS